MQTLAAVLCHLAAAALGLLAGAMLFIAVVLVPYWRSLAPAEFARWFRENSPFIGRVMLPLGGVAAGLAVLAALVGAFSLWPGVAAGLAIAVMATYPVYFAKANAALAGTSLGPTEIAAELRRWAAWHWLRTIAGALGFLAALHALSLTGP